MQAVFAQTMRNLDASVIASGFCSGYELMRRAGTGAAEQIFTGVACPEKTLFMVLTGKGNNGGDGFVIAEVLLQKLVREYGISESEVDEHIRVYTLCSDPLRELHGDALQAFQHMNGHLKDHLRFQLNAEDVTDQAILIDALLGTGFSGKLRDPIPDWISIINHSQAPVVSIDVPSGLSADDGHVTDQAVRADMTITFVLPKQGLLLGDGPAFAGRIHVCSLDLPDSFTQPVNDGLEAVDISDALRSFPPDARDTFKNRKGHTLVIGGSCNYPGAVFLSAEAALRAGSGLVTACIPEGTEIFFPIPKALIVRKVKTQSSGFYSPLSAEAVAELLKNKQAAAIGPGLSTADGIAEFLKNLFPLLSCPVVLDADALNLL